MGTAPPHRKPEAMPDPVRLAHRSVSLLQRLGMTEQQAREMVDRVVHIVAANLLIINPAGAKWLWTVMHAAHDGAWSPNPSSPTAGGNEHADGTGS